MMVDRSVFNANQSGSATYGSFSPSIRTALAQQDEELATTPISDQRFETRGHRPWTNPVAVRRLGSAACSGALRSGPMRPRRAHPGQVSLSRLTGDGDRFQL